MRALRIGSNIAVTVAGLAVAGAVAAVLIAAAGVAPANAITHMATYAAMPSTVSLILDTATVYFLAGIAVAIGLRAGMFNIGVNGQYLLGALAAGAVVGPMHAGATATLAVAITIAAGTGAAWAGIAAWLRTSRGVSEVISTIMLNFVALAVMSLVLIRTPVGVEIGMNMRGTQPLADDSRLGTVGGVTAFLPVATAIGAAYWLVIKRTRWGFDLRATGQSPEVARTGGVDTTRMRAGSLVLSGAVAGLAGLPYLLGDAGTYSLTFPREWGWTGIAVALIGRNSALGVALASLLWAYLDIASGQLVIDGVPREVTMVLQGLLVIIAVLGYQIAERWQTRVDKARVVAAAGGSA